MCREDRERGESTGKTLPLKVAGEKERVETPTSDFNKKGRMEKGEGFNTIRTL